MLSFEADLPNDPFTTTPVIFLSLSCGTRQSWLASVVHWCIAAAVGGHAGGGGKTSTPSASRLRRHTFELAAHAAYAGTLFFAADE